ncbi:exosortase-dependent surface protein XDP1 [Sedimenticola sp.]|uniref:exosortase-dependent surface protein XDP1 n=1 Tax=Sedimenticola sp. TaxID=1940285 RepID=UPI003D0CDA9D
MKQIKGLITIIMPALLALLVSGNAAADWSWDFNSGSYGFGTTYSSMSYSGSGGAPDVTVTGWSNANYASSSFDGSYGTGDLVQRNIAQWGASGLGVYSSEDGGVPTHAMDNQTRIDAILLNFGGTSVTLDQVRFGWVSGDSDFSMSAYTGGGSTNLSSMGYGDLTSNGWTTIGSYYDPGTGTTSVNAGEVSSSYWLISALNPEMGGINNRNFYGNDFFKLASLGGTGPTTDVPEPSTLLLLGGVLLMLAMRRRLSGHTCSAAQLQA